MKRVIEVNGVKYPMKNLQDLTVKNYQEFLKISNTDNEFLLMKTVIRLLTDITWQLDYIQLIDLYTMDWKEILDIKLDDKSKLKRKYIFNNKKYYLPKFELLRFENWIDINSIIKSDPSKMAMIIAILISKDYDLDSIEALTEQIENNMSIRDAYIIFDRFITWREMIFKKYEGLFTKIEPVEDDNEDEIEDGADEWLTIAYSLTNEDITKKEEIMGKGIIEILNWLVFLQEKRESEKEAQKRLNNN